MASADKVEHVSPISSDVEHGVVENASVPPKRSTLQSVGIIAACSLGMMINVRIERALSSKDIVDAFFRRPITPRQLSLFPLWAKTSGSLKPSFSGW